MAKVGDIIVVQNPDVNYQVRAVKRAMSILTTFNGSNPELSLVELTEKLGLNKSTVLRLLCCLEDLHFIERNPADGKYRLGIKTFEVGSVYYLSQLRIDQVARPFMEELVKECNVTVNLGVLDDGEVVYVGILEPLKVLRVNYSVGARVGIHVTSLGKVLVADLPEAAIDQIIARRGLPKHTEHSISSPEKFKQHLVKVREQGYAVDNEEILPGLKCIGAPIRDYMGKAIAALSISGTIIDMPEDRMQNLAESVKRTAELVSAKLGYQETI